MIERAGDAAKLSCPVHVHMLRHSTGYALAAKGMDTRRLQHFLGHASIANTVRYTAMSPEPFKDIWRWIMPNPVSMPHRARADMC
jgi:type 1 fimbriae regulatory protein FimB